MKSLIPRGWETTRAIYDAKKKVLVLKYPPGGKKYPAFNGSQTRKNSKKRPITLPEKA